MSKRAFLATEIGLALMWPYDGGAAEDPSAPPGHEAAFTQEGADTCLKCHDADRKVPVMEIFSTPHANRADLGTPFADKQCESCHGAGGDHAKRLRRGEERPHIFAFEKGDGAKAIDGKCLSCHDDSHTNILRSIKGVGLKTAAPFLAEMGKVQHYASHKKLIAFAGWDPSVRQSGKFVGISKLSKRGNRHLRRAIYLMTASVVSQNAFFKAYFLKRKREGLPPQKALCATAHKLLRVIFAMLTQRTYFKPKEVI